MYVSQSFEHLSYANAPLVIAISGGSKDVKTFAPEVGGLQLLETAKSSIRLGAKINMTNPTEYTATVPYVDINLLSNGTQLGHATAQNITVGPGTNHNIPVEALWNPVGEKGASQGRELLSQYISG